MPQRLVHRRIGLLTASASRLGGGVFEAVVAQARLIADQGGTPVVIALDDAWSREDRHRFGAAEVLTAPCLGPRQVGFAPALGRVLDSAQLHCLHLHGIWMYPSAAGVAWASRCGRPYIVSPHGMLDPWITRRGRWKKALARLGYERRSWQSAWRLHALTAREADDIARETGRSDALVIPNAGPPAFARTETPAQPHFVYIGRIHAKKNLHALLTAWRLRGPLADGRLTIAGWGDAVAVAELERSVSEAGPSVSFVGPVFGTAKDALLTKARFVILPSLSEGLPMAVLEAWSRGTPVLMTGECNLPEGFAAGAALDCGYSAESIAATLRQASSMNEIEWRTMSEAALALAAGPFSAERIGHHWADAYHCAILSAGTIGGEP